MTLGDLVILMLLVLVIYQFFYIRSIAESAKEYLEEYCNNQDLQLLSVARSKTKLGDYRGKITWKNEFSFEFSGDGESKQTGVLLMAGKHVLHCDTPAYRI